MNSELRVAIIGQGYVGLHLTRAILDSGQSVIGIDLSRELVERLQSGISHIEGVSSKSIADGLAEGTYLPTIDFSRVSECNVVIIAVPTPMTTKNEPDLTFLEDACRRVAVHLNSGTLIISESTSYVGTLRNIVAKRIQELSKVELMFAVAPERVDPGNEVFRVENTPRIVGGLTKDATARARFFYSKFCKDILEVSTPEVAEAAKLLENSFRYINIAFINEFTKLMNSLSVSANEVIEAASTKPFGFTKFLPSAGVGGHCIAVDPFYLQKNALSVGEPMNFISLSKEINDEMPSYLVKQLQERTGSLIGKSILVIGLSYKPNVADTRESASFKVIEELKRLGAHVYWHDPIVEFSNGINSTNISDQFDLGIVLVNHRELDLSNWGDSPIFCINKTLSEPSWVPLLAE